MSQVITEYRRPTEYLGLVLAGYVMAFVLPIGGLITGFLLCEKRTGHAVAMILLSVWSGMFWLWLTLGALL